MELINDGVHKGLELFRLHPWRYGLIIYGIIGLIVFIFQMAKKEDTTHDVVPKFAASAVTGLFWLISLRSALWYSIGIIPALIALAFAWLIILIL